METEYTNNEEPRMLSKFEQESLKDWYWNEMDVDGGKSDINYKEWYESMSWSDIDEIISHYTNEDDRK